MTAQIEQHTSELQSDFAAAMTARISTQQLAAAARVARYWLDKTTPPRPAFSMPIELLELPELPEVTPRAAALGAFSNFDVQRGALDLRSDAELQSG